MVECESVAFAVLPEEGDVGAVLVLELAIPEAELATDAEDAEMVEAT